MAINVTQWADVVLEFSSQWSDTDWSAKQALGEPNTFEYYSIPTAWTASEVNGTIEFLTVAFDNPVFATAAMVRETNGNGFVTKIEVLDLMDQYHQVWTGVDPSQPGTPVEFEVTLPVTQFLVQGLKITIDTDHNLDEWEEVDAIRLKGKTEGNTYFGTNSKDIAAGDGENDTIYGLGGNDVLSGGAGADTIIGNFGDDQLKGEDGDDNLVGGAGKDTLDGGAGNDITAGGSGDDTYTVNSASDVITEGTGAGNDLVNVNSNYTIGNNVERLTLTGTGNINGTGNTQNNTINGNNGNNILTGNAGNDILNGGANNDTLVGGAGVDVLTGGTGSDAFRFNFTTEGVDNIKDFVSGTDKVQVENANFGGGLVEGVLLADQLVYGAAAADANDRFIYNFQTQELFFDADGNGGGVQTKITKFSGTLILPNANDIVII